MWGERRGCFVQRARLVEALLYTACLKVRGVGGEWGELFVEGSGYFVVVSEGLLFKVICWLGGVWIYLLERDLRRVNIGWCCTCESMTQLCSSTSVCWCCGYLCVFGCQAFVCVCWTLVEEWKWSVSHWQISCLAVSERFGIMLGCVFWRYVEGCGGTPFYWWYRRSVARVKWISPPFPETRSPSLIYRD